MSDKDEKKISVDNDEATNAAALLDLFAQHGTKVVQVGGPDGPQSHEATLSVGPRGITMSPLRRRSVDPRMGGCGSRGCGGDGRGEAGSR